MGLPSVEACLPELMGFVESLARETETGDLAAWPGLVQKVRHFFTPEMMQKVDGVIPGWRDMAAYADGETLVHVVTAFAALLLCPEYRQAAIEIQRLLQWIVLFHDLAKVARHGKRDLTHSFRSAALSGIWVGKFSCTGIEDFEARLTQWASLTFAAKTRPPEAEDEIPDNRRLPEIVDGVCYLFGRDTPAALIVQTVLFHQAIDVVADWPQAAPLTEPEIQRFIGMRLLPLLKVMMLVDNDAWGFFDVETKRRHRTETLAAFRKVEALIHH